MRKLYFTIGLPRSGKSTECTRWLNYQTHITQGCFITSDKNFDFVKGDNRRIVVTPDRWRLAMGHRYNWFSEPLLFGQVQIAIRALLMDYDVLVDDTHTTRESVKRILEVDPDAVAVPIKTDPAVCKERAIKTNQKDLFPVIDRMSANMFSLYGIKFEKLDKVIQDLKAEVLGHSSRKVVV